MSMSPTGARYVPAAPGTRPGTVRRLSDQSVERAGYFEHAFEEVDELGSGEFGKVIKVRSRTRNAEYAVKKSKRFEGVRHRYVDWRSTLLWPRADWIFPRLRLREEVEILQHLTCGGVQPNVLTFVDSWEEDDVLYIQTELCA
jgi:mitosis inhibitor protein kinase SWE1